MWLQYDYKPFKGNNKPKQIKMHCSYRAENKGKLKALEI